MTYATLIQPEELAEYLADPQWVIFDCRFTLTDPSAGRHAYTQGHIPGAYYVDLNEDLSSPLTPNSGRHPLPYPDALADKLGAWGVNDSTQVVVYDASSGAIGARLWWLLRWLGHTQSALLNGGFARWQRENRPVFTNVPPLIPTLFHTRLDSAPCVDAAFVERMLNDKQYALIDARAEERFSGEVEPLDKVAGHIPGAVNMPFEDNLAMNGSFLSIAELHAMYSNKLRGMDPQNVVHMCGSGVTACHNILAMEHAGLHGARLYAGSWSEWITDSTRPIAAGSGK